MHVRGAELPTDPMDLVIDAIGPDDASASHRLPKR